MPRICVMDVEEQ